MRTTMIRAWCQALFGERIRVTIKVQDPGLMTNILGSTLMRIAVLPSMVALITYSLLPAGSPYTFIFNKLRKGLF